MYSETSSTANYLCTIIPKGQHCGTNKFQSDLSLVLCPITQYLQK